jgi:hypothetical protein
MCIVYTNEHGVDTNSGYWKIEHSIVPWAHEIKNQIYLVKIVGSNISCPLHDV